MGCLCYMHFQIVGLSRACWWKDKVSIFQDGFTRILRFWLIRRIWLKQNTFTLRDAILRTKRTLIHSLTHSLTHSLAPSFSLSYVVVVACSTTDLIPAFQYVQNSTSTTSTVCRIIVQELLALFICVKFFRWHQWCHAESFFFLPPVKLQTQTWKKKESKMREGKNNDNTLESRVSMVNS